MTDSNEIIRSIFGTFKIKYNILKNFNLNNINALHINCDSLLNFFLKYYGENLIEQDSSYAICSSLINLAAHFRHFFAKNKFNNVTIYFYVTDEYKSNFKDVFHFMDVICKYIPNIYFIHSIPTSINVTIKYFCNKHSSNLVFTKSKLDLLLVSKNISILKANKDNSILYTSDNVYSNLLKKDYDGEISYKLLPIIFSYAGIGCSKIKGLGISKVIKKFDKAIKDKLIINMKYSNIENFIDDIGDFIKVENKYILIDNFNSIDIHNKYKKYITAASSKKLDNFIIDKFANNDLKELNIKYFTGFNALMLDELFETFNKNNIRW